MTLSENQRAEIRATADTPGFSILLALVEEEIKNKLSMLTDPPDIGNQKLERITALQGEIRGLRWWINKVK